MNDKVHDEPSNVAAVQGRVVVDGPDGVAILFTPEAALETGHRLIEAATAAHGQKLLGEDEAEPEVLNQPSGAGEN